MTTTVTQSLKSAKCMHKGMGALPYDGGASFRVWAPFAKSVHVAGSFNSFSPDSNPLSAEGDGYWAADIDGVPLEAEYRFVIRTQDNRLLWHNDPYARAIQTSSAGENSVLAATEYLWTSIDRYRTPPWNDLVIYELHVGTFDFDENSPLKRGTLQSVIGHLDYLKSLGINAIEVMAAGEFAYDISWGYNPSYIFAIEQAYGGPNAFRALVDAAHERDIAIIFDVVYNHLGPDELDLWQFDGWQENNLGGIYFYNDWRSQTPWGNTRPDYGRREIRQYIRDNALRWLEQRYVDGLRWDATGFIRNVFGANNDPANDIPDGWSLMQWINSEIEARQPWKISIAEDMQNNEWLSKDVRVGGAGFDAQWDAGFVHTLRSNVISKDDRSRDMYAVADAIGRRFNDNAFERVIYTESHDEVANGHARVPEEIWPGNAASYFSQKRSTLGASIVFTAPGIPMIFQGQEFLQPGWFSDQSELDWGNLVRFAGINALYRELIRLRRDWYSTSRGLKGQHINVFHINNTDKVIAFHRWDQGGPGDDVLVVANFGNRAFNDYSIGFPRQGIWKVLFNSDWDGYSPDFGSHFSYDTEAYSGSQDGLPCHGNIGIGAYSAIILSQQ